jgi:hypothetical protein
MSTKTFISHIPTDKPATSIVIHINGGHSQITAWDYNIEVRNDVIYVNDEAIESLQIAPPFVLLVTAGRRHAVIVHEPYFRKRAAQAGIDLPEYKNGSA